MRCIEENRDKIKAIATLKVSFTAKLVGQVMVLADARTASDIIDLTGLSRTTAYRAMNEFMNGGGVEILEQFPSIPLVPPVGLPTNPTIPADGIYLEKTVPPVPPVGFSDQPLACADITTRANTESSSKILITSEVKEVSEVVVDALASPKAKRKTSDGKTSLPDDWQMPVQWIIDARTRFPVLTASSVAVEVEKFTNHFISTGTKHKRWELTWRNWLLRNYSSGPIRPSAFRGQSIKQAATYRPSVSQIAEAMEELNAEYAL